MEVTNRYKGLDLTDSVPEKLWTEVRDTVQEAVIKTVPKKNAKRQDGCLEEALHIAEKRRETKSKGEKERYPYLQNSK